jgi:hypothetical protein
MAVPSVVPAVDEKCRFAGSLHLFSHEMMTEDAKFALGF